MAVTESHETSGEALHELIDERTRLVPLSVEQYHRMIADGILPEGEPYELLCGQLIHKDRSAVGEDPMTVGEAHIWVVQRLAELNPALKERGTHLRIQQPIVLPPVDEPEPDGAIVRGTIDDYRERKPGAGDILCIVEVAEASLTRDRTAKSRIYARAGIAPYVIVNLRDRVVEVATAVDSDNRRYGENTILSAGEILELPTAGEPLAVEVASLLP